MVVVGVDAHKQTHTLLVVDGGGRELGRSRCGQRRRVISRR